MRSKRVWRYYCDFCKKSGCSAGHIRRHEASCCSNPNRVCRMCAVVEGAQQPVPVLLAAYESGDVDALRNEAGGCPACMLSAIIAWQKKEMGRGVTRGEGALWVEFDFKAETKSMWDQHNAALAQDEYEYTGGPC